MDNLVQAKESHWAADSVFLQDVLHWLSFTVAPTLSHSLTNVCKHRILLLLQYREGTTLVTEATNDLKSLLAKMIPRVGKGSLTEAGALLTGAKTGGFR